MTTEQQADIASAPRDDERDQKGERGKGRATGEEEMRRTRARDEGAATRQCSTRRLPAPRRHGRGEDGVIATTNQLQLSH